MAAASSEELRASLAAFRQGENNHRWWQGPRPGGGALPLVFLFTGHGSHYVNMGRGLYENVPVFRQVLQRCDELLRPLLPLPLLEVLYPPLPADGSDPAQSAAFRAAQTQLNDMTYGQPAMFALEYALAAMWRCLGRPARRPGRPQPGRICRGRPGRGAQPGRRPGADCRARAAAVHSCPKTA